MNTRGSRVVGVCVAVALSALLPGGRASAATTINFDTLPGGGPLSTGALVIAQYSSVGVTFSSPAPAGGPITANNGEASSGPNYLVGIDPGSHAGLHPITMNFTSALPLSVNVTLISVGCGTVTATAYASDLSTILDSVSLTHGLAAGNGFGNHDPITLSGPGIARVAFTVAQTGPILDGYGIDDVVFTTVPTPGPAAALAALGLLGSRHRR